MALVVKDRVKETTSTTGTSTLTLGGAVAGFQTFTSVLSNGDTTYYAIFESSTGQFEVGLGTFTSSGTTLARTTVLESSNSGNAINLTAGAADVFITQPAEKAVYLDASGHIAAADGRNVTNVAAATATTAGTVTTAAQPNITSVGTLTTLTVDDITINGSTISDAADLTIDVGGQIILDADNTGYVLLKDGGTHFGTFYHSGNDFGVYSAVQDGDLLLAGNDGGSVINAITLDMSDAGTAIFNHDIKLADNGKAIFGAGSDLQIFHDGSNSKILDGGTGNLHILADSEVYIANVNNTEYKARFITDGAVELYYDSAKKLETTSTGIDVTGTVTADLLNVTSGSSGDNIVQVFGGGTIYAGLGVDGTGAILTAGSSGSANAALIIKTSASGTEAERMRVDSTGINVTGTAEVDTLKFSDNSTQTSAGASTGKAIAMAIVFG